MNDELVTDVWGENWRVRETRETPHGFLVYLGSRAAKSSGRDGDDSRKQDGSPSSLIATEPLVEFLRARASDTLVSLELPLSTAAVWQLRRRLGISQVDARSKWWEDRMEDLKSLGASEFARKYGVSRASVYYHRNRLLT